MRELTLIVLCLVGCTSAYLIKVPTSNSPTQPRIAPLGWVHIQKLLLPLFDNVCEESTNMVVVQLAKDFSLDTSNGNYLKADVIENLRTLRNGKGLLPKGEIFTEYNVDHIRELKALFEVFLYAKDFDTFYKAAAWARQNVNCGLFVDAIYLAIINRKDTEKVSVPAPYELLPNYFINKDVVVRASFLLTADQVTPEADVHVEGNSYVLDANYTAELNDGDEDCKLAYFREDIGLNSYYFIRKLQISPWFNTPNNVNNLFGEHMFMMMKQFAARYDLERYSHGLPELEGVDWESAVAYDPMLIYSNGNEFDQRTSSNAITDSDGVTFVKTIENNIAGVVTHLRQAGHSKSQILSHLMEILVTSDKSYETMSRKLLGDKDTTESNYSVLEHYMTTLRDPMFWRINKKMVQLISNAFNILPSYTRNELYFPGVEIVNVETKKMMTSFDNFQFDVTDSLKSSTANTTFQVKISQPRLNHKPFTVKLNISSLVYKKGLAKIFIGPKMMPGELAMKKHLFVLLDSFEVSLKRGYNVISRSSEEMTSFSNDFVSLRALRKKVEDAEFGLDALPLKTVNSQIGYPSRLILPRGLAGGLPLQLFVFVAPLTKGTLGGSSTSLELNTAILSPGYPLDLPIEIRQLFGLPNSLVKEITVTHKSESVQSGNGGRPGVGGRPGGGGRPGMNTYNIDQNYNDNTQTDYKVNGNDFNEIPQDIVTIDDIYDDSLLVHGLLGDRPEFTYKKTDTTTNYGGKKNQYRMKEDYASRRMDKSNNPPKVLPSQIDSDKWIPVTISNDNYVDTLPIHGLLGARPDFTYKNKDSTSYGANKSKFDYKKEDYVSKRTNLPYDTTKSDQIVKNLVTNVALENVIDDDILINDDLLVTHRPLQTGIDEMISKNTEKSFTEKKYQYIKKEEDRALKRDQKKEKYITKGEQKKDESITKGEQKLEDHLAKREKVLNDLAKKRTNNMATEKYFDMFKEKKDSIPQPVFEIADDDVNIMHLDSNENDINYNDKFTTHSLMTGKSSIMNKDDVSNYDTKIYQYKKKKEVVVKENSMKNKNMDENTVMNEDKNKYSNMDTVELSKTEPQITIDASKSNELDEENTKQNNVDSRINKEITKNIDKSSISFMKTNNKSIMTKDMSKLIKGKELYKNIMDDTKSKNVLIDKSDVKKIDETPVRTTNDGNKRIFADKSDDELLYPSLIKNVDADKEKKNIVVNKGTVTKKDITKKYPIRRMDQSIERISGEKSDELREPFFMKNVDNSKEIKNIMVDKGTVTFKDITKNIPALKIEHKESSIESISVEDSKEIDNIIYSVNEEVAITTEIPEPRKRVTVYDFLFNTPVYTK